MHLPRIGAPLNSEPIPSLQWIEVASSLQIPSFHIIGLPAPEVAEARERVRSAIESSGLEFPRRRVVVNLSPASVRKRGTGADLAMALAILGSRVEHDRADAGGMSWVAWAELGLDGALKPVGQVLRTVYAAWRAGAGVLLTSPDEYAEAVSHLDWLGATGDLRANSPPRVIAPRSLAEAWTLLRGGSEVQHPLRKTRPEPALEALASTDELLPLPPSLERVVGIAAAGLHHLLLLGPKGTGKSHALDWLVAVHPPASPGSRLKARLLAELAGARTDDSPIPVRRVGSGARPAALTGFAGPHFVRPGEFSLSQGGILVADEFPEWARDSREALREPMERGRITLTRAQASIELPARFTLAATGNLCPCGGWPRQIPFPLETAQREEGANPPPLCRCPASARRAYLRRLSGPILDRIDLVHFGSLRPAPHRTEKSRLQELRARVAEARERARRNWGAPPGQLSAGQTEEILRENSDWERICSRTSGLSLRGRHKLLRLALTLASWDGEPRPRPSHFAEAARHRAERFGFGDAEEQSA